MVVADLARDLIEANAPYINNEVWSWLYQDGNFTFEPLGALPPPAGLVSRIVNASRERC